MKKVVYCGQEFVVPDVVKYVAADDDGSVWGYIDRPPYAVNYDGYMKQGSHFPLGNLRKYHILEIE